MPAELLTARPKGQKSKGERVARWLALFAALVVTAVLATGFLLGPGRGVFLPIVPVVQGAEAVQLTTDGALPDISPRAAVCGDSLVEPRLSPDGRLAASVVSAMHFGRRLETVHVWPAGRPPAPEASENDNRTLCWSPDGQRLAYLHQDGNQEDLVVSGADGATLARLALSDHRGTKPGYFFVLAWSPESDRIALLWRYGRLGKQPLWRVYLADAHGTDLRLATEQVAGFATFLASPWGDEGDIVPLHVDNNLWAVALTPDARARLPG
jgi:hypothetical protein